MREILEALAFHNPAHLTAEHCHRTLEARLGDAPALSTLQHWLAAWRREYAHGISAVADPERDPAAPPAGEVAASSIAGRLQPYIGELPPDPRQPARYADSWRDESVALRVYRTTLRDERCQAALDQRLDAAISRPWEVEAGGDDAGDRRAADDLEAQLRDIDFDAICRQLLHGVWYGYAIAEAIWRREESRVALGDLIVRAPDRFRWSPDGAPLLRSEHMPIGEDLPDGKFVILARPGEHGDPAGPGSRCAVPLRTPPARRCGCAARGAGQARPCVAPP